MTIQRIFGMATLAMGIALGVGTVQASSHREAPAISQDPTADNTDVYAWVTPGTHDKLNVVLGFNPLEEPSGGPNFHEFSTDVLYQLHITRGVASLEDVYTYQFRFQKTPATRQDPADLKAGLIGGKEFFSQLAGQKMTMQVTRIEKGIATIIADNVPVAPPNIGPRTYTVAQKGSASSNVYDDAFAATFITPTKEGGRVWAGPRDDAFYVDLGGIFDLANLRPKGAAQDGVSGYNVHAIAIEIPTGKLTDTGAAPTSGASDKQLLGIWSSASRPAITYRFRNGFSYHFGPWVQVSRLGLPLINEAVIGIQDKDRWNNDRPSRESTYFPYILNPVVVRDAKAVGIYTALGVNDTSPFESNRLDIVDTINLKNIPTANAHNVPLSATGDVLRVDMGVDSNFPNGRSLINGTNSKMEQVDVTDTLLTLLLSKGMIAIKDGVDYNDKPILANMPWLPLPWSGYGEGHGRPTP